MFVMIYFQVSLLNNGEKRGHPVSTWSVNGIFFPGFVLLLFRIFLPGAKSKITKIGNHIIRFIQAKIRWPSLNTDCNLGSKSKPKNGFKNSPKIQP